MTTKKEKLEALEEKKNDIMLKLMRMDITKEEKPPLREKLHKIRAEMEDLGYSTAKNNVSLDEMLEAKKLGIEKKKEKQKKKELKSKGVTK